MSRKNYEIAFRLGAKMDSSLRTAFASANKSVGQLNKNSGTLARSSGTLSRAMQGVGTAGINMTKRVSSGIATGLIAPFRSAIGMVKQYAGALGLLSGGALAASGMGRLSAIENARTSLTVMMGDAGRANKFMDDVLAFAKTTPFAFPDLAETSRNLIAFGMDEAKVVPTLKAIGDAAAATGKGSEGLNQVASAFGDMQIAGTLGLDQINRLQSAGVPALKIMANTFGISTDEMKKKISKGSVDSVKAIDQLVKGMQEGTKGVAGNTAAMAGIMEETKNNWTGSVDSMKSSISSTMATIMEPAKPHIQAAMAWFGTTFSKLPGVVFGIVEKVKPIFETIGGMGKTAGLAIRGIFKAFQGGTGTIEGILDLRKIGLSDEAARTAIQVIDTVKENFRIGFSEISKYSGVLKDGIESAFSKIGPIALSAGGAFLKFSDKAREVVAAVAPYVKQGLGAVVGVVGDVVGRISAFWNENGAEIIRAVQNVAKVIGGIFKFLAPVVLFLVKMIWGNIKGVIQGGINVILGLVKVFSSLFTGNWAGLWAGVKQLFFGAIQLLWNLWNLMIMGRLVKGISVIAKTFWGFLKGLGPRIATSVQYYYHLFIDAFHRIGIGILRAIGKSIGSIIGVARNAVTNFITIFQTARTFGVNIFMSIVSAIRNMFASAFSFIGGAISNTIAGVMGRIGGFIASIQGFLVNLWTNITTIFMQIQTAMTNPFSFLSGVVETVVSSISGLVTGMFTGVTAAGKGAVNGLVIAANAMIGGINKLSFTVPDWIPGIGGQSVGFNIPKIPMLEQGGVTTGATLAMIGEGAEQEAVLPLSKLNALLDTPKGGGGSQYSYSPTYILQGNATKDDVKSADRDSRKEFDRWVKNKETDDERLKFRKG